MNENKNLVKQYIFIYTLVTRRYVFLEKNSSMLRLDKDVRSTTSSLQQDVVLPETKAIMFPPYVTGWKHFISTGRRDDRS